MHFQAWRGQTLYSLHLECRQTVSFTKKLQPPTFLLIHIHEFIFLWNCSGNLRITLVIPGFSPIFPKSEKGCIATEKPSVWRDHLLRSFTYKMKRTYGLSLWYKSYRHGCKSQVQACCSVKYRADWKLRALPMWCCLRKLGQTLSFWWPPPITWQPLEGKKEIDPACFLRLVTVVKVTTLKYHTWSKMGRYPNQVHSSKTFDPTVSLTTLAT